VVGFILAATAVALYALYAAGIALESGGERVAALREHEIVARLGVGLRQRVEGIDRARLGAGEAPAAVGVRLQAAGLGPGGGAWSALTGAQAVQSAQGSLQVGVLRPDGLWEFVPGTPGDVMSGNAVRVAVRGRAGRLRALGRDGALRSADYWVPSRRAAGGDALKERNVRERDCVELVSVTGAVWPSPPSDAQCALGTWTYAAVPPTVPSGVNLPAGLARGVWRVGVALEDLDAAGRAQYCALRSDTPGDCLVSEPAASPAIAVRRRSRELVGWPS